ncbi:hypothetical protein [Rhizobium sp. 18065]|uniref:hypothetical protein n=1 Tax=Rhizobium sp. 18065 TaxID=2681411 RepID=UPI00135B4EA7|nr:hypothetical protein [Rhizobium sp. 18065]
MSAASNIYLTHQETRAPSIGVGSVARMGASVGAGSAVVTVATTTRTLEQNTEIAGRLNLLLLTGQERMSQNLSVLADLLGSALKMERLPHETLSGYAVRLVDALGDLSPRERVALQRILVQAFAGLQLRTLMEAFRNPAGPEAATLSIYLELYRQKDRDLAARSVVTSYRQNAGEVRAPAATVPTSAGSEAPPAPAAPPAAYRRDAETQKSVSPAPAERYAVAVEADGDAHDGVRKQALAGRLEPSPAASLHPTLTPAEDLQPVRNQVRNLDVAPHLLQAHLDEAFSAGKPIAAAVQGPSAGLPEQTGRDGSRSLDGAEPDDNNRLLPGLRHKDVEQGATLAGWIDRDPIEPDADTASFAVLPGSTGSVPTSLATSLAALLVEAAETDLVRALLNLRQEDSNSDVTIADSIHSEPDDQMTTRQEHGLAGSTPDEDALNLAQAQRIRSGGFEEQVVYAMTMPPSEPPATLVHPGLREAIPVPFVNYLIVDEFDPDLTEVEERQHAEDQEEDDDEHGDDDLADDGPAGDEPNEQVAEQDQGQGKEQALEGHAVEETLLLNLPETRPVLTLEDLSAEHVLLEPAKQDDPAHDLYLRMSGFI